MDQIQGSCTFESLDPEDLMSAVESVKKSNAQGLNCSPPGAKSVDELLNWSLVEISSAHIASGAESKERQATNAVMQARRALSCLVDWYLKGFGFSFCKDPPSNSWQTSGLLLEHGIIDELTRRVLSRAIDVRNSIEHDYASISVEKAEDIVELLRRTCRNLMETADPSRAPCFFGDLSGGHSWRQGFPTKGIFYGWNEPFDAKFILMSFCTPPWLGVIIPTGRSTATVRKAWLSEVPVHVLSSVIKKLQPQIPTSGEWMGPDVWMARATVIGLFTMQTGQTEPDERAARRSTDVRQAASKPY